jgi:hypothetical protein
MPTSRRTISTGCADRTAPTPVADWLARQPVVDLRLWLDVRWAEQGLVGDPEATIAWMREHGETLSDRLIDAGVIRRRG